MTPTCTMWLFYTKYESSVPFGCKEWKHRWMMYFNPSQCEVIPLTKKRNPTIHAYKIINQPFIQSNVENTLGVNIANKLSWNIHTLSTIKKANNSLSFLRRNITSCPQDIKPQTYKTVLRPILEYAGTAWDPHTATNINQLEAVRRRDARFVKR